MRLKLSDVRFCREATEILRGVDLHLDSGEIGVLVGPSGCGKTTTLRCIAGLESITSGQIQLGDRVVSSVDQHINVQERRVGYVLQDSALFPHLWSPTTSALVCASLLTTSVKFESPTCLRC